MTNVKAKIIPTWSTLPSYKRVTPRNRPDRMKYCYVWVIMVPHTLFRAMVAMYGNSSVRLRIDRVRLNRTVTNSCLVLRKKETIIFA